MDQIKIVAFDKNSFFSYNSCRTKGEVCVDQKLNISKGKYVLISSKSTRKVYGINVQNQKINIKALTLKIGYVTVKYSYTYSFLSRFGDVGFPVV